MTPFGTLLKHWRGVRRISQLDLALSLGMSPRHVSFLETGRSRPTEPTVARLCDGLDVPVSQRNALYRAAGLAPAYIERPMDDPALAPFRSIIRQLLERHEPYPAIVLDRMYKVVQTNRAASRLFPLDRENALEVFLHPSTGPAMVENWAEVAWAALHRLRREAAVDEALLPLLEQVEGWLADVPQPDEPSGLVACARVRMGDRLLSTITTVARFDAAQDPLVDTLRIELMFPADDETAAFFHALAEADT